MHRRQLLIGSAAAGAALPLAAVPTLAIPSECEPVGIFADQTHPASFAMPHAYFIRTYDAPGQREDALWVQHATSLYPESWSKMVKVGLSESIPVTSVPAAEAWFASHCPSVDIPPREASLKGSIFQMYRGSNRVARATRRGRARHVVVHPDRFDDFVFEPSMSYFPASLYAAPWVPRDRAFVFYRGESVFDVAGAIHGDRLFVNGHAYGAWVRIAR